MVPEPRLMGVGFGILDWKLDDGGDVPVLVKFVNKIFNIKIVKLNNREGMKIHYI